MSACKRLGLFCKGRNCFFRSNSLYSTHPSTKEISGSQKEITVPYRIERGPTDILKALASTISKDHTAAHYKYEDDPYFIPVSNVTKRSFALSKESGKKAARYFLEKYPELFKCNKSVPDIKAFNPPMTYSEEDNISEKTLQECITNHDVQNCINVFNILMKKGISLSTNVSQDLLDLLCFYNNSPPPSEDYYEERFFQRIEDKPFEKWKVDQLLLNWRVTIVSRGMAEKIFEKVEKNGRIYSSMIAGLAKYGEAEKALQLHDEMKSKGFIGTVTAYNSLISECHLIHEDYSQAWEIATYLLNIMNADKLKPDIYTMNALLRLLFKVARWRKSNQLALNVIAEMKRLKIEPSLGSYYYLFMIFVPTDINSASILYQIMDCIENKEHEVKHPSDMLFFATAMEICWKSLHDKDLAYRLHNLLEFKNNCKLLGNAIAESYYFKNLFRLLCEMEDIDVFMEFYDKYVPNSYTPEPVVILHVVQTVHFVGAYKYLPRLCSDILLFEQSERTNIVEAFLEAAACTKNEEEIQKPLVEMAWNLFHNLVVRSKGRRNALSEWNSSMLGNLLKTFINGQDIEKSWNFLTTLQEETTTFIDSPEKNILIDFCLLCLSSEEYTKVIFCVNYAVNGAYPEFREDLIIAVDELYKEKKLNEKQLAHMNTLLRTAHIESIESSSRKSLSSQSSSSSSSSESSSDSSDEENKTPKTDNVDS